jgi:4a-hydroxytetrahydrobiopterin dehydratase
MAQPNKKLSGAKIAAALKTLEGWVLDKDGALYREFHFADFPRAFGFMASVAIVAQALDHHPNWSNVYNEVSVHLISHDSGGLTHLDFELAKRMNQLASGE